MSPNVSLMNKADVLTRIKALEIKDFCFSKNVNKWDKKYVLIKEYGNYSVFYYHEYKDKEKSFTNIDDAYDYLYKLYGGDEKYLKSHTREEIFTDYYPSNFFILRIIIYVILAFLLIFSLSYNKKTNNLVLPIIALSVFVIFAIVDEVFGKKNKKYQEKARELMIHLREEYVKMNPESITDYLLIDLVNNDFSEKIMENIDNYKLEDVDYDIFDNGYVISMELVNDENELYVDIDDLMICINDHEFSISEYDIKNTDDFYKAFSQIVNSYQEEDE